MSDKTVSSKTANFPFYFVLLYLFLEFGRPQEMIPDLAAIRPGALAIIMIALSIAAYRMLTFSDKQTKLFIIMLTLMVFHGPFALNNYWAFHTFMAMFITFVAYLGIITFVNTFDRFKMLINVWLGIHVYLAIIGIMKGGRGIGGFLGDENDFCMTMNMIIPFSFFITLAERNRLRKIIYIGMTLLFIFVNMLTLSRGGFTGLTAVGIYFLLRSPRKIMSVMLITLLVLFMFHYAPEKYWEEVKSIQKEGTNEGTGGERIYQWKIGWKMFLDNPILGVGQGNFPWEFSTYEGSERFGSRSRAGRAAHSVYFTLLPELGTVGTVIFVCLLYFIFKDLKFLRRFAEKRGVPFIAHLSHAMEGGVIGFLVSGIFISVLYYPNLWILMGFVVSLRRITETNVKTVLYLIEKSDPRWV